MMIGKILVVSFLVLVLFQSNIEASEDLDLFSDFKVSKSEIQSGLDSLKLNGKISEEDYQKAKKELESMSDGQLNSLKDSAVGIVKKDPEKAIEMLKSNKIDPKEVQKQMDEISKKEK